MCKKISAVTITSIFMMLFAVNVYAASNPNSLWPIMQCGYGSYPTCDFKEAVILVNRLLKWFLSMAGVVATITFTIAGFKILTHPDSPGEITKGRDMLIKTVIGLFIVLGAWIVVNAAVSFFVRSDSALMFLRN